MGAILCAIMGATACFADSPVPLKVALPAGLSPRTIGYFLAQQKGFFSDAGLDVSFQAAAEGHTASETLAAGKADLAIDMMPHALYSRENGAKIVNIAQIFRYAGMELVCRPAVDRPAALKNRTIGVTFGGLESAFYAWMTVLDLNPFGGPGGVTVLRQNLGLESFKRYQVDCATSYTFSAPLDFVTIDQPLQGMRTYRYQDLGQATLEDGIYARAADLANPDAVATFAKFLAATRKGWQLLHDTPKAALDLLQADPAFAKVGAAVLRQTLNEVDDLVAPDKGPIGKLDPAAYDRTVNLLLTAAPDPVLTKAPARAISDVVWKKMK